MKDRPQDFNQTWLEGWKWCRFTNAPPRNFGGPYPKFGAPKT